MNDRLHYLRAQADRHFAAWSSWRHPVWLLFLLAIIATLLLVGNAPTQEGPSAAALPGERAGQRAPQRLDLAFVAILEKARIEAIALAHRRLQHQINIKRQRVETRFLPAYLSFGERKLEEVQAYNLYALDRLNKWLGRPQQDRSTDLLVENFRRVFAEESLRPEETRRMLQRLGMEVAGHFTWLTAVGLEELRLAQGADSVTWQEHLESLPTGTLSLPQQPSMRVGMAHLAAPHPVREALGEALGRELNERFRGFPEIASRPHEMRYADGQSIFATGKNAWAYYGSYLIYWLVLIILIRSEWLPVNLSGALLGWIVWEILVWGIWIGMESLDFEQTRTDMEPVILLHADRYYNDLLERLGDTGPQGPWQALGALQALWQTPTT
jgi:hypothetical protein